MKITIVFFSLFIYCVESGKRSNEHIKHLPSKSIFKRKRIERENDFLKSLLEHLPTNEYDNLIEKGEKSNKVLKELPHQVVQQITSHLPLTNIGKLYFSALTPNLVNPSTRIELNENIIKYLYLHMFKTSLISLNEFQSLNEDRRYFFIYHVWSLINRATILHINAQNAIEFFEEFIRIGIEKKVKVLNLLELHVDYFSSHLLYKFLFEMDVNFLQLKAFQLSYFVKSPNDLTHKYNYELIKAKCNQLKALIDLRLGKWYEEDEWMAHFIFHVFKEVNALKIIAINVEIFALIHTVLNLETNGNKRQEFEKYLQNQTKLKKLVLGYVNDQIGSDYLYHHLLDGNTNVNSFSIINNIQRSSFLHSKYTSKFISFIKSNDHLIILELAFFLMSSALDGQVLYNVWLAIVTNKPHLEALNMQYNTLTIALLSVMRHDIIQFNDALILLSNLRVLNIQHIFSDGIQHDNGAVTFTLANFLRNKKKLLMLLIGEPHLASPSVWPLRLKEIWQESVKSLVSLEYLSLYVSNHGYTYLNQFFHHLPTRYNLKAVNLENNNLHSSNLENFLSIGQYLKAKFLHLKMIIISNNGLLFEKNEYVEKFKEIFISTNTQVVCSS